MEELIFRLCLFSEKICQDDISALTPLNRFYRDFIFWITILVSKQKKRPPYSSENHYKANRAKRVNLLCQQESAEEETPGLPFLSDLALSLSVVVGTHLTRLYQGSDPTQDEEDCQHLLKSRLLQRLVIF